MNTSNSPLPQDKILMPGEPGFVPSEQSIRSAMERCRKRLLEKPGDKAIEERLRNYEVFLSEHYLVKTSA